MLLRKQINGEPDGVKRALFAISSIMYKFGPKEPISLETTVAEVPPSIIIPSDVPIYPPGGLYPSTDSIVTPRSLPPILGTNHLQDIQGYGAVGNKWPIYSSALPVATDFGAASLSADLVVRVLCPPDKIGLVIGKGGGTIKGIRQTSGARIEVNDTKDKRDECVITITSTEVFLPSKMTWFHIKFSSSSFFFYFFFINYSSSTYRCTSLAGEGNYFP